VKVCKRENGCESVDVRVKRTRDKLKGNSGRKSWKESCTCNCEWWLGSAALGASAPDNVGLQILFLFVQAIRHTTVKMVRDGVCLIVNVGGLM
jgi:hypothetical protein